MSAGDEAFRQRVYAAVRKIPRGRVATYGQIAALVGLPRAARAVGRALAVIPPPLARVIPWQRVVNAAGGVSRRDPEAMAEQRARLAREGITIRRGGIDLARFAWSPRGSRRAPKVRGSIFHLAHADDLREGGDAAAAPLRKRAAAGPRARAARGAGRGAR